MGNEMAYASASSVAIVDQADITNSIENLREIADFIDMGETIVFLEKTDTEVKQEIVRIEDIL